jgi:hypothetical protein
LPTGRQTASQHTGTGGTWYGATYIALGNPKKLLTGVLVAEDLVFRSSLRSDRLLEGTEGY